jgi:hypothetical protein
VQVTANNSISLAQFDYAVKFEEEYREAIASGAVQCSAVQCSAVQCSAVQCNDERPLPKAAVLGS